MLLWLILGKIGILLLKPEIAHFNAHIKSSYTMHTYYCCQTINLVNGKLDSTARTAIYLRLNNIEYITFVTYCK